MPQQSDYGWWKAQLPLASIADRTEVSSVVARSGFTYRGVDNGVKYSDCDVSLLADRNSHLLVDADRRFAGKCSPVLLAETSGPGTRITILAPSWE
jgi:hypothetical protein